MLPESRSRPTVDPHTHIPSTMRCINIILGLAASCGLVAALQLRPSDLSTMSSVDVSKRTEDFSCPHPMEYSPWIKACSCPPGQSYDAKSKDCKGKKRSGAWPKPSKKGFSLPENTLSAFCAMTPTKVVEYDARHKYCQAGVNTIIFVAKKSIANQIRSTRVLDPREIGEGDLRDVLAGLSGLYLPDINDADVLFNTDKFNLGTLLEDVLDNLPSGIISIVRKVTCLVGIGGKKKCKHDCVSYCTEGCGNFLDGVVGEIGGLLDGLNGLCILNGVVEIVDSVEEVVSCLVDDLLCVVGNVLKELLDLFDCKCDGDRK